MAVSKEKMKEYQQKYYQKNKRKINKYKNEYAKAHKDRRNYKRESELIKEKYKRYSLLLDKQTALEFSKKLESENETVSNWFRVRVKKYLDKK